MQAVAMVSVLSVLSVSVTAIVVALISAVVVTWAVYSLYGVMSARRYVLAALALISLDVCVSLRLQHLGLTWTAVAWWYFCAMGVLLCVTDVASHRLPNSIVLPSYPALAVGLLVAAAGTGDWAALVRSVSAGALTFGAYFLLALAYPPGMGFGDVKLAGLVGAMAGYLSWSSVAVATLVAFAGGGLAGAVVVVARRGGIKTALPFGPFMLGGVIVAVFAVNPTGT
jgi:leader peptidase (prepilin peptidase)/N-methyltransferase